MKYGTQKVAYYYFAGAMILFIFQVVLGALAGTVYVLPNFLAETLPFNILRMMHTNALIVWTLMAFFGAGYYCIPEEAERDIESPLLAYIQLGLFMFGALAAVVGYAFRIHEGREFLEQPLWIKIDIVVVALIFLYNVSLTVMKGRKTAITNVLLLGLWGLRCFGCSRSTIRPISHWISCTGGTWCTSGWKACGSSLWLPSSLFS